MAAIYPSDIVQARLDGESPDELKTLRELRDSLPEDYSVYHSVHWSNSDRSRTAFGEIDFVVVNNKGHVLVVEQKNGAMEESSQGLEKRYSNGKKLVSSQVSRNIGNLRTKFRKSNPESPMLTVDYIIYCPDHRVIDVNAAAVDMVRTVDASSRSALPERIQQLLPVADHPNEFLAQELHNFLVSSFRICPDIHAYKSNQDRVYLALLGGLSDIIDSLEFDPFRLRIVGTAGSGKTQVTMRFCERCLEAGRKPLLLCYNRPLADKLSALAPDGVTVDTYHGFCKQMAERVGVEIDFAKADEPDFWRKIQNELLGATLAGAPQFDCLVVDEGQDFKADWYDIIQMFVSEEATQLWLEDPLQNLRGNDPIDLPRFVTYRENGNFRTPTRIAEYIKAVLDVDFTQRNSLPGLGVGLYEYETQVELQRMLNSRVHDLGKAGFGPEDIAIVSCRGMSSTALGDVHQLGKHKIRKFTGEYDSNNNQIYTDGDLNFDSIFRFKGQQAPAVILVDLDDTLKVDERVQQILYCAMTRATVRLEMVVRNDCDWLPVFREHEQGESS